MHRELWIPSEELSEFNARIDGLITVESAYFGREFRGEIPEQFGLARKDAFEQVHAMITVLDYSTFDFQLEISANARAVFLNYPFWAAAGPEIFGVDRARYDRLLDAVRTVWSLHPRPTVLIETAVIVN